MKLNNIMAAALVVGLVACSGSSETIGTASAALTPTWTDYAFTASPSAPYSADLGSATNSICGLTALSAQFNQSSPATGVNLFVSGGDWQVSATVNGAVRCFAASDFTANPSSLTVATVPSSGGSGVQDLSYSASTSDCLLGELSGKMV